MSITATQTSGIKPSLQLDTLVRYLLPVSLVYLALPGLIFFISWLKPSLALLGILLTLIPLIYHFLPAKPAARVEPAGSQPVLHWKHWLGLMALVLLIGGISGIGGYGPQDSDWLKHNAILKDLIQRPWPVVYEIEGVSLPMVYYLAYYLPAALAGKAFGAAWTNHILLIWSLIGFLLSLLWFIVLARRNPYLSMLIFVIFSGLDALGTIVHIFMLGIPGKWNHFEWWAENWQYSAHITQFFFVPHQALCGWIISGILLYHMLRATGKAHFLFYLSLSPLWSPLITLGLAPFLAIDFFMGMEAPGKILKAPRAYLSLSNLCGLGILLIYGLFYSSKFYATAIPLTESIYGFIFNVPETDNPTWLLILGLLIWFILLEFGLYAFLIGLPQTGSQAKGLFVTTVIFLTLLPLFKYGRNNDLVMRASIPALFIFALFLAQAVTTQTGFRRTLLITLLVIGSVTPLVEVGRHFQKAAYEEKALWRWPDLTQVDDLFVIQKDQYRGESFLVQYLGSAGSPFFKFMAKESNCQIPPQTEFQPVAPEPVFYTLSERLTLTCLDRQQVDDHLQVRLFLQAKPPPDDVETHDTIYVHLVNDQGERVAGSDILLYKNYEEKTISIHDIPLPPELSSGGYHLVVGTYYFDKDMLVNVGSVNLEAMVTVH